MVKRQGDEYIAPRQQLPVYGLRRAVNSRYGEDAYFETIVYEVLSRRGPVHHSPSRYDQGIAKIQGLVFRRSLNQLPGISVIQGDRVVELRRVGDRALGRQTNAK